MTKRPTAVCIVVENLPVPLDRRVWREACALRSAGYRVSVICPKGKDVWTAGSQRSRESKYTAIKHGRPQASQDTFWSTRRPLVCELFLTLAKVFARTRFRILQACNPPDTIFLIALLLKFRRAIHFSRSAPLVRELFEAKLQT